MTTIPLEPIFKSGQSITSHLLEYSGNSSYELTFGKYTILKYLGKRSFARVFKAINSHNKKVVAIKIIELSEVAINFATTNEARTYLSN